MLEAEQKARELVDRFKCYRHISDNGKKWSEVDYPAMKKWALICVDEIIKDTKNSMIICEREVYEYKMKRFNWWQEVKANIEKL